MPDSPEVRIARLDESLKNLLNRLDTISEAYAPTNKTVIENALKIAELQKDLDNLNRQFIRQLEKREELFRNAESKVLACAEGLGALERKWEKQRIATENRERRAKEAADAKAREERTLRIRWAVGIAVSFVLVVLGAYLGTVFG